ncbi:alanine racemase [Microcella sp.]|uniref:alanine racemase n=1 Tax=Microcella sp. TaxID=1913979 RepID=UPI0039191E78
MSAAPEPLGVRRVARLSARALDDALTALLAEGEATLDLRADAYGHGADEVERRARARGIHRFVRDGDTATTAEEAGLGMLAYGLHEGQQPVLSLEGEVVAVKRVPAGTAVSYGYQYRTSDEATLALVGLGYADGVPRLASSRAPVRIGGATGIVAGRIAMDQLVVDLGAAPAQVGDVAVLWHDGASLAAWSAATERPAAALLAGLGRRIQRRWVES